MSIPHRLRAAVPALLSAVLAAAVPHPASPQLASASLSLTGSGMVGPNVLGSPTVSGWGATALLGVHRRLEIEASGVRFAGASLETGASRGGTADLTALSVGIRGHLFGTRHDVALLAGAGGITGDRTEDTADLEARDRATLPAAHIGIEVRMRVAGPLHLSLSARDWLSYAREDLWSTTPGERTFAHAPDIRIAASIRARRRPPGLSGSDYPLARSEGLIPVPVPAFPPPPPHAHDRRTGDRSPLERSRSLPLSTIGVVHFSSGSATLPGGHDLLFRQAASALEDDPRGRLVLRGYTDLSGDIQGNASLAERRASAIREVLVRLYGVPLDRVDVISMGPDYRAPDAPSARRVEVAYKPLGPS